MRGLCSFSSMGDVEAGSVIMTVPGGGGDDDGEAMKMAVVEASTEALKVRHRCEAPRVFTLSVSSLSMGDVEMEIAMG